MHTCILTYILTCAPTDLKANEKLYPDELEDLFYETLDRDFCTMADDGSVEEVRGEGREGGEEKGERSREEKKRKAFDII